MPNNLQHVAPSASEDKQIASVRIAAERFLDLERQAVHTSPHICPANRQPDPDTRWNRNPDRTSALMTAFAKPGDTEIGIRTWPTPPTITSIVGSGASADSAPPYPIARPFHQWRFGKRPVGTLPKTLLRSGRSYPPT